MTSEFKIEFGEDQQSQCACCGELERTGHGFVYKEGEAFAVYYCAWSFAHPERGVSFAIAVGDWDDDATVSDRVCMGVEAFEGENDLLFHVIDPAESPWPNTDLLGPMLSREQALLSDVKDDIFEVAESIVRQYSAVSHFLHAS